MRERHAVLDARRCRLGAVPVSREAAVIERLRTFKQSLGNRQGLRRAFFVVLAVAVLVMAGRFVHHRMTHLDVTDARIASEMIAVASRSPGWLSSRPVKEGDSVHRGQTLGEVYAENASLAASAQAAACKVPRPRSCAWSS